MNARAMCNEDLSFAHDKRRDKLPRERLRRRSGAPPLPPAFWTARDTFDGEPDEPKGGTWGAYPKGFVAWVCRGWGIDPREVLHVCSGSLRSGQGLRVDLRREAKPDVIADGRALPLRDGSARAVMIDSPYSVEYAASLYGTEYARPSHLLAEASRVVRPCGYIGILHFIVPMPPPDCELVTVHGVTTGCGYRIRGFTVFRRAQESML